MKRILFLAFCTELTISVVAVGQGKQDKKQMKPDPAMAMALKNMEKVMLDMKMEERPKYMMKVQEQSIGHGKDLFNDTKLGTVNRSCNTCHPSGGTTSGEAEIPMPLKNGMIPKLPIPTLIGAAAQFPKYKVPNDAVIQLGEMNNNCIRMFMMGKPLDLNGKDARDLVAYVSTLSNGREVEVGKIEMMKK